MKRDFLKWLSELISMFILVFFISWLTTTLTGIKVGDTPWWLSICQVVLALLSYEKLAQLIRKLCRRLFR